MLLQGPQTAAMLIKLIVLVAVVALMLGGGLFAWSKFRATAQRADTNGQEAEGDDSGGAEQEAATQTVPLGEFLVNLQSADGTLRYLQTEISLVVIVPADDEKRARVTGHGGHGAGDESGDLELPAASQRYARDVVIEVLSSQQFETLRDRPDRSQLKAKLQQRLDAALTDYQVVDVLFTAFVMQ